MVSHSETCGKALQQWHRPSHIALQSAGRVQESSKLSGVPVSKRDCATCWVCCLRYVDLCPQHARTGLLKSVQRSTHASIRKVWSKVLHCLHPLTVTVNSV